MGTTKADVLVVWPNQPRAMDELERAFILHHYWNASDQKALLAEAGSKIRGIVTTGERGASAELISACPKLEIISCFGVGVDGIDHDAAKKAGVIVTNTPEVLSEDVADYALGLMLCTLRQMVAADRYLRQGLWQAKGAFPLQTSLKGKTLGMIGMGRIGQEIARRCEMLGMKIAYHNRRQKPQLPYAYAASPVELAAKSDVLALACPGGDSTFHLVNAEVLKALGERGFLINVSRGSVVDEKALISALKNKVIAGAGLDVFEDEPHVPAELIDMDHVVLQPHAASATHETRDAMGQLVVDNLKAHFGGQKVLTPFP